VTIRLKKNADGGASIRCARPDGSVTWQRQDAARAAFFVPHDLTHYAVETVLGHRRGFYGLLAEGWDIGEFGTPWPRGPIPADADPSELWVGLFDAERAGRAGEASWVAAAFNAHAAGFYAARGMAGAPTLTDAQLRRIRQVLADLLARWQALPPGEAMELTFEPER
jgi:hypothetical protein